jgi:hypothetical protein
MGLSIFFVVIAAGALAIAFFVLHQENKNVEQQKV